MTDASLPPASHPPASHPPAESNAAFVHPTAVVDDGAELADGVRVWHFAHVCGGARIGPDSVLGQGTYVGPSVRVGRGCKVQNHVSLYEGVVLEDEVFVGPSAVFTNVRTPRAHVSRREEFAATHVGRHATIGANATIVCGARIGERAFVGAGATVTGDVAPGVVVLGTPARPAGFACVCGEMLGADPAHLTCARCQTTWVPAASGGIEREGPA